MTLDDSITAKVLATDMSALLAARGITTVGLDAQAQLIECRPDGTAAVLDEHRTVGHGQGVPA